MTFSSRRLVIFPFFVCAQGPPGPEGEQGPVGEPGLKVRQTVLQLFVFR